MESQTKYFLAGSIIAGLGTIYAIQNNLDSDTVSKKFEENENKFADLIEQLVDFALELLEKIILIIKRFIQELIFQFRLAINK